MCKTGLLLRVPLAALALMAPLAASQAIRNYTTAELFPGQICADNGTPWEGLWIGACPQGYNGIRRWAGARNESKNTWPPCNPCKQGTVCAEFKPGVAKCTVPAPLAQGEVCLDFSGGKGKWHPVNKALFERSCVWPEYSCNLWKPDTYRCERVREGNQSMPVRLCYRAAGSKWWGGTDQAYYWHNATKQFKPCGGPNPDYPRCPPGCKA